MTIPEVSQSKNVSFITFDLVWQRQKK